MLLAPEFLARLERLAMRSPRRVRGLWAGGHASLRLGESLDFADYREYSPGDDFRRIDHSLWARLGVVLVRLFEAEDELPIRLIVDQSASMAFGGKSLVARRLAGTIGFLGLLSGDRVAAVRTPSTASDVAFDTQPASRHASAWPALERFLAAGEPAGAADLRAVGRYVAGSVRVRGPNVVISDFLGEGMADALDAFGSVGGGIVMHVLAPEELDPDFTGDLRLVDAEDGRELNVSTTPETMQKYREAVDRFTASIASHARKNRMEYVLVPAIDDAHEAVLAELSARQLVK